MSRKPTLTKEEIDNRTLSAAREHFSKHCFYGARVDAIAATAALNKRMIYEFSHKKEGLYLAVLSDVSNRAWAKIEQILPQTSRFSSLKALYLTLISALHESDEFVRLWAWERMRETINGARILETVKDMERRILTIIDKSIEEGKVPPISEKGRLAIALCLHGLLLTMSMLQAENIESEAAAAALDKRLDVAIEYALAGIDHISAS